MGCTTVRPGAPPPNLILKLYKKRSSFWTPSKGIGVYVLKDESQEQFRSRKSGL